MRVPVQRFSSERTGSVKYSTSCPWRTLSPCVASRAMPTNRGPESGSKGREDNCVRLLFAIIARLFRSITRVFQKPKTHKILVRGQFAPKFQGVIPKSRAFTSGTRDLARKYLKLIHCQKLPVLASP